MPSAPIFSHIIGTVALLLCASLMTYAFSLIGSSMLYDLTRPRLQEISDYIAKNMLDLTALAKSTNETNVVMIKEIQFPQEIGYYGYSIRLSSQNSAYFVTVMTDIFSWLNAQTEVTVRAQEATVDLASGSLGVSVNGRSVMKSSVVPSGVKALVWVARNQTGLYVGVGYYNAP